MEAGSCCFTNNIYLRQRELGSLWSATSLTGGTLAAILTKLVIDMKNKYFKKFWNETTGDEVTDSWGNSTYYFETDENLNVLKQVQIFENKKILKYDEQNFEDQYGFLTDQPLEMEDFEDSEISEIDFYEIWK